MDKEKPKNEKNEKEKKEKEKKQKKEKEISVLISRLKEVVIILILPIKDKQIEMFQLMIKDLVKLQKL